MMIAEMEHIARSVFLVCEGEGEGGVAVLNGVVRRITEEVTFGHRLEGDEGVNWADCWGKSLPEWWKGGSNSPSEALN